MNVNLIASGENVSEEMTEHQDILTGALADGTVIVGFPVLIPEGSDYPGSYQVWSPVATYTNETANGEPCDPEYGFVYVDTEGRVVYIDELPDAEVLADR